jgi:hypothetical protein
LFPRAARSQIGWVSRISIRDPRIRFEPPQGISMPTPSDDRTDTQRAELGSDEVAKLLAPLRDDAPHHETPLQALHWRARRRRRWRAFRRTALGATALALVVTVVAVVARDDSGARVRVESPPAGTAPTVGAATSTSPQPTTTTSTRTVTRLAPPWSNPPLARADVAAVRDAWSTTGQGTRNKCPALAPSDLGEGGGATARVAERNGPDMWWVAWDLPGGPGESAIQTPCKKCGRETFFVSGQPALPGTTENIKAWSQNIEWTDGSQAGYGVVGRGRIGPGENVGWIAYLRVASAPECFYQVLSYISEDHLLRLLTSQRRVAGAP